MRNYRSPSHAVDHSCWPKSRVGEAASLNQHHKSLPPGFGGITRAKSLPPGIGGITRSLCEGFSVQVDIKSSHSSCIYTAGPAGGCRQAQSIPISRSP